MKHSLKSFVKVTPTKLESGWKPLSRPTASVIKEEVSEKPVVPRKHGFKTLKDSYPGLVPTRPVIAETVKEEPVSEIEIKADTPEILITEVVSEPVEIVELKTEEVIHAPPVEMIDRVTDYITKTATEESVLSFQQPKAAVELRTQQDIVKRLKYLESWLGKVSVAGPGGGAGDVINLDHPVKLVTGDYTLNRRDYYVGVNSAATAHITIPDSIGRPGRRIIIKDESGRCSRFPIVVNGNVDGDPGGFILRIDNGAVQMIYREGWRIV